MKDVDAKLGQRLRQVREEAGLSLREMAALIGMSHAGLSQQERGEVKVAGRTLYAVAEALGKPVTYVLVQEDWLERSSINYKLMQMEQDDAVMKARSLLQETVLARYGRDPKTGIEKASDAIHIWRKKGDHGNLSSALVALGDIYALSLDDWTEADRHYGEALRLMEALGATDPENRRRHAQTLWARSRVLTHKEQYAEALDMLDRARTMVGQDGFCLGIIGLLAGTNYIQQGELDRSRQRLTEALRHAQSGDHPHGQAEILLALAEMELADSDPAAGERYLEEAAQLARQEEYLDVLDKVERIRHSHDV